MTTGIINKGPLRRYCLKISARVQNSEGQHQVIVSTNENARSIYSKRRLYD